MIKYVEVVVDKLLSPTSGVIVTHTLFWQFVHSVPDRIDIMTQMALSPTGLVYNRLHFDSWYVLRVDKEESRFMVLIMHVSEPIEGVWRVLECSEDKMENFHIIRKNAHLRDNGPVRLRLLLNQD